MRGRGSRDYLGRTWDVVDGVRSGGASYTRAMRRAGAVVSAVLLAALLFAAGLLAWRGLQLLDDDLTPGEEAAVLQALGGAAALGASVVLVGLTVWYSWLTAAMLRQSGPVIVTELRFAWTNPVGTSVVSMPFERMGPATDPRYSVPLLAVVIRNKGNAAGEVTKVNVAADTGMKIAQLRPPIGPTCPLSVGPHSEQTCYLDPTELFPGFEAFDKVMNTRTRRMRAEVELGSGATVVGRWNDMPRLAPRPAAPQQ